MLDTDKWLIAEKNRGGTPDFEQTGFVVDYVKITPFHESGDSPQHEFYPDNGRADAELPKGWLLWHSYKNYADLDSKLFLRTPDGTVESISGDFIHAMNGCFGRSPEQFAFMAIDKDADEWDVYLSDHGEITNITGNSGFRNEDPKFSPDGKTIVFKRGHRDINANDFVYDLALLDVKTMTVTMLTDDTSEEAMPCFSEDGKYIYFARYTNGIGSICRLDLSTKTSETVLGENGVNAYYPIVGGDKLYFTKWCSADNHCDTIICCDGGKITSMPFDSKMFDCSDACPIGGTVSTIGEAAFYDCDKMKNVTMSDSVTKIDDYAFSECDKLESISFSDSISYIAPYVFIRCGKLSKVDLPSALKTITFSTFNGCESLSTVNVDSKNENYCSVDGVVYSKDMSVLYFYPDAKTDKRLTIPETVTTIEAYALEEAKYLETITLPSKLEYIGTEALALTGAKTLTIPESVNYLGSYCLYSNTLGTVIFKGSAPRRSGSPFNTRGTYTTDVYCHFSDTSWYTFMDEFTENVNWIDLDAYPDGGIELSETAVSVKEGEELAVGFRASPDLSDTLIWKRSPKTIRTVSET